MVGGRGFWLKWKDDFENEFEPCTRARCDAILVVHADIDAIMVRTVQPEKTSGR